MCLDLPDNGGTWQPVNNGLTRGNSIKALIVTVNGYLFARSYGDGVFLSSDNGDNLDAGKQRLTVLFVFRSRQALVATS